MTFNPIENSNLYEAHHKDHIRTNNYLWNLEWLTIKEHSIETCLNRPIRNNYGMNNSMSKLSEQNVIEIINLIKSKKYSFVEISNMFNISYSVIENIAHNRAWTYLNIKLDESDIRLTSAFNDDEVNNICKFFQSTDINNKLLYPKINDIFTDCFNKLGLYKKYDLETKRKTMERLLYKNRRSHDRITSNYDYNFIK